MSPLCQITDYPFLDNFIPKSLHTRLIFRLPDYHIVPLAFRPSTQELNLYRCRSLSRSHIVHTKHMEINVVFESKLFEANLAAIGFISSMNAYMSFQI